MKAYKLKKASTTMKRVKSFNTYSINNEPPRKIKTPKKNAEKRKASISLGMRQKKKKIYKIKRE